MMKLCVVISNIIHSKFMFVDVDWVFSRTMLNCFCVILDTLFYPILHSSFLKLIFFFRFHVKFEDLSDQ